MASPAGTDSISRAGRGFWLQLGALALGHCLLQRFPLSLHPRAARGGASGSRSVSLYFVHTHSFPTILATGSLFKITFIELYALASCVPYFSPARDTEWTHPRSTKEKSCHLLKLMVGMKIIEEFVFGRQLGNIAQEL